MRLPVKTTSFELVNDFGRMVTVLSLENERDREKGYLLIGVFDLRFLNGSWVRERVIEFEFKGDYKVEKVVVTKWNGFKVEFFHGDTKQEVVIDP